MVSNVYGNRLPRKHPTAVAFVDETGAIANDRIFGVGLVKTDEASQLLRGVQHLRDQRHWYKGVQVLKRYRGRAPDVQEVRQGLCRSAGL